MELSLALMSNIGAMLIWVLVGYLAVKLSVLKTEDSRLLSSLTIYIFCPCMILMAFQIDLTPERLHGFLYAMAFVFVIYLIWIVLTQLIKKPLSLDPVDTTSLVYSNVGNLVIPLVSMTLGEEMTFYAASVQVPFNLLFWTHGNSILQERAGVNWEKLLKNINLIAVVLGLILLALQVKIPGVLNRTLSGLSSCVAPCSMMAVGVVLAGTSIKSIFTSGRAYWISFGRLILYPLIAMTVLYFCGLFRHHPELVPILLVSFMSLSAPTASNVAQMAVIYDQRTTEASIYNILSMFFCVITIPLVIWMYQLLFM